MGCSFSYRVCIPPQMQSFEMLLLDTRLEARQVYGSRAAIMFGLLQDWILLCIEVLDKRAECTKLMDPRPAGTSPE